MGSFYNIDFPTSLLFSVETLATCSVLCCTMMFSLMSFLFCSALHGPSLQGRRLFERDALASAVKNHICEWNVARVRWHVVALYNCYFGKTTVPFTLTLDLPVLCWPCYVTVFLHLVILAPFRKTDEVILWHLISVNTLTVSLAEHTDSLNILRHPCHVTQKQSSLLTQLS